MTARGRYEFGLLRTHWMMINERMARIPIVIPNPALFIGPPTVCVRLSRH